MADYRSMAAAAAQKYGIDPNVFLRQINQESGFNPNARSGAGALGIAQFMPATARAMGVNPMDPASALDGAARLMAQSLHKYGSYAAALSVYNSGRPDAYKDPNFAGGQTYHYVKSILGGGGEQPPAKTSLAQAYGQFERIDQGVDFNSKNPVGALGSGVIESIGKGMAGGTGYIIKERLDKPVTVNGRTYGQVYYSEENPLVKQGQRVGAGQGVMQAGGNELGFLDPNGRMAPLEGGLGAGTKASQMGRDFLAYVNGTGGRSGGMGGGGPSMLPPQPPDLRQHIVAQKVDLLGHSLAGELLSQASTLSGGGSPNLKNLFTLAKGYQKAKGSQDNMVLNMNAPRKSFGAGPPPLGGSLFAQQAGKYQAQVANL